MDKKLLFRTGFSALLVSLFLNAGAVTHVVQVNGSSFSPSSGLNVSVGDTIQWVLGSGSHTTTSTNLPIGAASWDSPINSSTNQFKYKVTVAGTYNYKCTPHNFTGSFIASAITGIPDVTAADIATSLYPNPFNSELFIEQGNEDPEFTEIAISDILGKQIRNVKLESLSGGSEKRRIDVSELPKGIYFVTLKGSGAKSKTIRLVKEGA